MGLLARAFFISLFVLLVLPAHGRPRSLTAEGFDWGKYFSEKACSTVFAQKPPSWISNAKDPGIFKNSDEWIPVCSQVWLKETKRDDLSRHAESDVSHFNKYVRGLDHCTESPDSKQSTLSSDAMRLFTDQERALKTDLLHSVQNSVARECCAKDEECEKKIKAVEIKFCEAPTDSDQPDLCKGNGTAYIPPRKSEWLKQLKDLTPDQQVDEVSDHFPVTSDRIELSPYFGDDSLNDYIHEMIHACNFIRRDILIRHGSIDAIQSFVGSETCEANAGTRNLFRTLFSSLGLNHDSIECISEIAKQAPRGRFDSTHECSGGCERTYLEESFAFVGADINPMNVAAFSAQVEGMCIGLKDKIHPLASDIFNCELKTPRLKQQFESAIGCKK